VRYYPVPYSTKEEVKLVFNLSTREFSLLLGGILAGVALAGVLSLITGVYFFIMVIICVPLLFSIGLYASFKTMKEVDRKVTLDEHYLKAIRYRMRPHSYILYRR